MFITIKSISRTIKGLAPLLVLVAWLAFAFCFQIQTSTAQNDVKFREFDRDMVHSPREMARDLNYLFFNDKKNPFADIDPEKLKKLRELGTEFLENLSDEEKKQAQEFSEKFMKDKGLDSPEGKLLMDSLGVSPEMQSELAKEFGENDSADLKRFQDLFKNSSRASADKAKALPNDSVRKRNQNPKSAVGKSNSRASSDSRSRGFEKGGPAKTGLGNLETAGDSMPGNVDKKDIPQDIFETLPDELNEAKRDSSGDRRGELSKGPGGTSKGKTSRESEAKEAQPDADAKQANRGDPNRNSLPGNASNERNSAASKRGKRGQGRTDSESLEKGWEGGDKPDGVARDLAQSKGKLGDREIEMLKGIDPDKRMADFLAELKNKRASEKKLARSAGNNPNGVVPSQGLDETFKSWIQMEAIKKGIRRFQERGGPSDFQRRSLESAFKKGFRGLGDSLGDTLGKGTKEGLSKSEFKEKFDRVLFNAAKDSSDFESVDDQDSDGIGGAVGSTLDGLLDRVSEAAKQNRERKQQQQQKTSQSDGFKQTPFSNDDPLGGGDFASGEYGTDALGAASDMLENIPELPVFDPQKILIFGAIAGVVLLLLYFLLRNFTVGQPDSAARKFGRSFKAAKIRSPKDLVEAVDYFIVQKFGNRAQWWNASHAQDMLCAGAPGYSAKISDLLKDYVRARYMRSDLTLSSEQQLGYKKTLQELAKEVSAEQQTPAAASQDEG